MYEQRKTNFLTSSSLSIRGILYSCFNCCRSFKNGGMIKVYIASPYTIGDAAVNVRNQLIAADELMNLGFCPFAPLYTHFQHMFRPRPYADWCQFDNEWVKVCDCVLRLPGESKGADNEVSLAESLGKSVFHSIDAVKNYYKL